MSHRGLMTKNSKQRRFKGLCSDFSTFQYGMKLAEICQDNRPLHYEIKECHRLTMLTKKKTGSMIVAFVGHTIRFTTALLANLTTCEVQREGTVFFVQPFSTTFFMCRIVRFIQYTHLTATSDFPTPLDEIQSECRVPFGATQHV